MTEATVCEECGSIRPPDRFLCPVCSTPAGAKTHKQAAAADRTIPIAATRAVERFAGRYRIIERLGEGGFGVVYRAADERLGREVALKVFSAHLLSEGDDRQRFEREALILASLDHPNIVTIFDAGIENRSPYFAMKLVRGGSLAARLRTGAIPADEALSVLSQVAAALEHAHRKGVLHRDIKPSNVLCDGDGRAYLADFGVSSAGFLPRLTQQGVVVGTMRYLAPEALAGRVSASSDVYALGTVLYESVFGQPCFDQGEPPSLIRAICEETPPLVATPPEGIHPELAKFVERLLAKKPEERPPSAAAVLVEAGRLRKLAVDAGKEVSVVSVPDPGTAVEPVDAVDHLERLVADIGALVDKPSVDIDQLLDTLGRFSREAETLSKSLLRKMPGGDDGVRHALALSLTHMTREVERRVSRSELAKEGTSFFAAQRIKLQKSVIVPMAALTEELEHRQRATDTTSDFFHFDELVPVESGRVDPEIIESLRSADDLTRHEAVLNLVSERLDSFIAWLRGQTPALRDELLAILWNHCDVILLEGRGRSRPLFELAVTMAGDKDLSLRWRQLYALFRKGPEDPVALRKAIESRPPAEKKVFARALLLHPNATWRELALGIIDWYDVWEVVSHPGASVPRLIEVWHAMRPRGGPDFAKIFFACTRDTLMTRGEPERVLPVIELLKEFYEVDVFHEDVFFRMLCETDEWVRSEARRHRILVDFDAAYIERLQKFLAGGVRKEQPVEGWTLVPLPIQRRLARAGHFTRHFACHPVDLIALECVPHIIASGNGYSFAAIPSINGKVLAAIAKEKRLWMLDDARFALVGNPKCPPPIILKYIGYLRKDLLKKLADSRECNALARQTAERMLARR